MNDIFEQIKDKISLVDYVSKFVKLKVSFNKYLGLCPFHLEKSPSFHVDPAKNLFYCFGCSSGGDIFDFDMKINNRDKKESLKALADLAHIELSVAKKNELTLLNEFFVSNLDNNHLKYLEERGLNNESIKKFEIGYAPEVNKIMGFIKKNNLNLKKFGFDDYFWKMFEKRIVFPIYDDAHKLCSFGGRTLNDDRAKYINGPNSSYFDKSKTFYSSSIQKGKDLYLVEGYFDVILLNQNGFCAVAAMGTSFGLDHLNMAWQKASNLIVAFDGDVAGIKSANKVSNMALENISVGKTISFIKFDDSEDPASFLNKNGNINQLIKQNLCDYIFSLTAKEVNNPDEAAWILEELNMLSQKINNKTLAAEYKRKWRESWWQFFHKKKKNEVNIPFANFSTKETLELLLFKYMLMYPEIINQVEEFFIRLDFSNDLAVQQFKLIKDEPLDKDFLDKIKNIGIIEKIESAEVALSSWHRVFEKLQSNQFKTDIATRFDKKE